MDIKIVLILIIIFIFFLIFGIKGTRSGRLGEKRTINYFTNLTLSNRIHRLILYLIPYFLFLGIIYIESEDDFFLGIKVFTPFFIFLILIIELNWKRVKPFIAKAMSQTNNFNKK